MSTLQTLKSFIHQRLAVAVDEILGLLETTVNNYEEELQRQRKIIESERTELLHKNNTGKSFCRKDTCCTKDQLQEVFVTWFCLHDAEVNINELCDNYARLFV